METKSKTLQIQLFLFALAIFSLSMTLSGVRNGDLYTSPTGSDSNTGTKAAPLKTISKASSLIIPGNTVHVAPGTYIGGFRTTVSGKPGARIRYVSDKKWAAKIIPTATSDAVWVNSGGYTDIIGFEITGLGITNKARLGISLSGGNSSVQNCHVHDIATHVACTSSGGAGIVSNQHSGPSFDNYDFIGNVVHNIGDANCKFIQGIYHSSSGTIKNNLVYAVGAYGIHLWHDDHNIDIVNNTVFGCGYGIVYGGGDQYNHFEPADSVRIYNNIVFDNTGVGISELGKHGLNNIVSNNLVFKNGTSYKLGSVTAATLTGEIEEDPQFVNYIRTGGGDYHLKRTSPAIDKGSSTYAPSTDLDGNKRPKGAGFDIGAYENMRPARKKK